MQFDLLANTDRYGIAMWGGGIAYSMFNKKTNMSFFVQGDDAISFRQEFLGLLEGNETPGSVYYGLSLNHLLAQLFTNYEHIAESDVSFADYEGRIKH